ncbi:YncE family protein [Streptomyces gibsoniae]|uniref:Ig-like domain repeat protein n=1 Tax=Streptomyces gibsoniae TaxID=3075529 RepID=A0ABU2TSF1_9ACTN|nr:Ig-like domain repeat protein [Streptomyces sp. DSM 41699]MDT0463889.1 Ig-like domain repeat protein [Streptomyces sp. DSM 41699]
MRSISTATSLAVLFSSVALCAVSAGGASATTPASVASPGGIVADGALHRVFIGDRTAGKIVAADYTGALVDTVGGISGVSDLAVSDDGSTLYATAETTHEIVALDAATLDVKARYAVATTTGPRYVAFAGGKVWFTYGDQWDGNLGSVDPAADPAGGTNPVSLGQFPRSGPAIWGPGLLDTDPSQPGVLAVGETGISTDSMAVVDVSGATPSMTAWYNGDYTLNSGISDIDLVPGGTQVLVNGAQKDAYADGKFTAAGAYPAGQRADISATGLVAQANGTKVAVYRPDAGQPVRSYTVGSSGAADLTWAPDSSRIFALTQAGAGYTVKVLTDPTMNVPTLTVNAPSSAPRAKALTVTGKLSATVPLPSGVSLRVTRTDLDNPAGKALASVTTKSDGSFSFKDTPPDGGNVKYTVSYAGDATHTSVSASDTVAVSRTTPTLTLNNNGKLYDYGKSVVFTAHLGSTYKNRTVEIWADPYGGDKPNKLLKSARVNSSGNLSVSVSMTRDTTVSAVFKGDARTAPRTVKSNGYARVKVSSALSKYYRTGRIGSTTYYYFHKNTDVIDTTTMTYYKGRQQRLDLQVYYQGAWYTTDSEYFPVGTGGKSIVNLGHPGESGIRARVRSAYINGSSGDTVNSTTYGAWKYFYFTN